MDSVLLLLLVILFMRRRQSEIFNNWCRFELRNSASCVILYDISGVKEPEKLSEWH